jgi:hypothetical protein
MDEKPLDEWEETKEDNVGAAKNNIQIDRGLSNILLKEVLSPMDSASRATI